MYYIFYVCVCRLSFPAYNAHAPYYIVICGLAHSTIFFHLNSKTALFSGTKLLNSKCLFGFSLQILSETFLILHVMYRLLLSDFSEMWMYIFWKYSNIKFHGNPSSGSRVVLCERRVRGADRHDEAFRNFANKSKYQCPSVRSFYQHETVHSTGHSSTLSAPRQEETKSPSFSNFDIRFPPRCKWGFAFPGCYAAQIGS